jgi:hypothetical protein
MPADRDPQTPDERRAYEQECLKETRQTLQRTEESDLERIRTREVTLEGSYPESRIRVRWWDPAFQEERSDSWEVWRLPVFEAADGGREVPNQVGMLIATWVHGG